MLKTIARIVLSLFFLAAGVSHFTMTSLFMQIMPPWLPYPLELVWISGLAEIILALALLIPAYQAWASRGLILLLIAVFPANIHMFQHPELLPHVPYWVLILRLPFQGVLIAWAYWMQKSPGKHSV